MFDRGFRKRPARHLLVWLVAAAAALLAPGQALAHVTAHADGGQPEKGGEGAIVLRVPNEEAERATVRLEVTIPGRYDLTRVRAKPVRGWSAAISRGAGGTVTAIVWTADDGTGIAPGDEQYDEFAFTAWPLPTNADTLVLPTKQVYADGGTTDWADERSGGAEPAHPAPEIALAEPSGTGHGRHVTRGARNLPNWPTIALFGALLALVVIVGVVVVFRPGRRKLP
ncbi:YcnI family protein [Lentzea sp. NPDC004789]